MVTVRYESPSSSFLTKPFDIGMRHLKVACSNGSKESLLELARERMIYRPSVFNNEEYQPLTCKERIYHGVVGLSETAGYVTLLIPFIAAAADRFFNKPCFPKGGYPFRTHMEEGGKSEDFETENMRRNPFDSDVTEDPFYREAHWLNP